MDMAPRVVELLSNYWNSYLDDSDPTEDDPRYVEPPDPLRLKEEKKHVPPGKNEYLLVAGVDERDETFTGSRKTKNYGTSCFAELHTIRGRDRREELIGEVVRICEEHNSRSESDTDLGGWDTLNLSTTVPEEEIFDAYPAEFTFGFSAVSRTI